MIFIENTSHDIITVWNCSKISLLPFLLEKGVDNGEKFLYYMDSNIDLWSRAVTG